MATAMTLERRCEAQGWTVYAERLREEIQETTWLLELLKGCKGECEDGCEDCATLMAQMAVAEEARSARQAAETALQAEVGLPDGCALELLLSMVPRNKVGLFEALMDELGRSRAQCNAYLDASAAGGRNDLHAEVRSLLASC